MQSTTQIRYGIGEAWSIEEDAPRWPDGHRLYPKDAREVDASVAEVLKTSNIPAEFDNNRHGDLGTAISDAMVRAQVVSSCHEVLVDIAHLSLAFLAGAEWQKRRSRLNQEHGDATGAETHAVEMTTEVM